MIENKSEQSVTAKNELVKEEINDATEKASDEESRKSIISNNPLLYTHTVFYPFLLSRSREYEFI